MVWTRAEAKTEEMEKNKRCVLAADDKLSALPSELIEMVMWQLPKCDVATMARVSRLMKAYATPVLWGSIRPSERALQMLLAHEQLRPLVRELVVNPGRRIAYSTCGCESPLVANRRGRWGSRPPYKRWPERQQRQLKKYAKRAGGPPPPQWAMNQHESQQVEEFCFVQIARLLPNLRHIDYTPWHCRSWSGLAVAKPFLENLATAPGHLGASLTSFTYVSFFYENEDQMLAFGLFALPRLRQLQVYCSVAKEKPQRIGNNRLASLEEHHRKSGVTRLTVHANALRLATIRHFVLLPARLEFFALQINDYLALDRREGPATAEFLRLLWALHASTLDSVIIRFPRVHTVSNPWSDFHGLFWTSSQRVRLTKLEIPLSLLDRKNPLPMIPPSVENLTIVLAPRVSELVAWGRFRRLAAAKHEGWLPCLRSLTVVVGRPMLPEVPGVVCPLSELMEVSNAHVVQPIGPIRKPLELTSARFDHMAIGTSCSDTFLDRYDELLHEARTRVTFYF